MKNNKTILMIAYYFPPAAGIGTFRITKFSKYLKKNGYNPIIISPEEKYYINKDNSLLNDLKEIPRYQVNLICKKKNSEKDYYFSLLKDLDNIITKFNPKYAFITGGPFYYLKIAPILYKKYGIKYIVDFRDPWSLQKSIDGNFLRKTKNKIYKILARYEENIIFKYASFITMVNDTMTFEYSNLFFKYKNKIITLPNAIDFEDYKNVNSYRFNNFVIIYTGKFSTSSGFRDPTNFLLALKNINQGRDDKIKFVHIGNEDKRVIDIVNKLECNKFVDFYGSCSYKQSISYCKGAEILLILSTNEKSEQTGKIYDYLGCNKKIFAITNKENEIYKICKEKNILVANPSDVKDIENKLLNLINTKDYSYDINNLESREMITKKLIKLYESIKDSDKND